MNTLCKYSFSLKFYCLSHFISSSLPKHSPFSVIRAADVSAIHTQLSITDHEMPTKKLRLRTRKENGSGFSSSRSRDEREKTETRFRNDKNRKKELGSRKNREMDSGNCSMRSLDNNKMISSLEINDSLEFNGEMEKQPNKGSVVQAKKKKIGKGSKKKKNDWPQEQIRVGLDMCSKRGDVMGAIHLYDLAQREGIKMERYHYSVLLYLCASAAVGVVQPAKSGSIKQTLNPLHVSSNVNYVELIEERDNSKRKVSSSELDVRASDNGQQLINTSRNLVSIDKIDVDSSCGLNSLDTTLNEKEKLAPLTDGNKPLSQHLDGVDFLREDGCETQLSEDVKKYALWRGFEIYEKMYMDKVPMNEATMTAVARMAMSMGNGDMAFDMVKQMKSLGINPKLRSYDPALFTFCNSGDIDKAFAVEKHMLKHGVYPEEPELEALLKVSIAAGNGHKVYYLLHKLRTTVRKVSPSAADMIVRWFKSKAASRVGKTKWNQEVIKEAIESRGGGWHGQGWLGKGRWNVSFTSVKSDAFCNCCGEKMATIDLDPTETENFAESVASIAIKRDKDSSFQKFQKWLDYYGPFEAVVDGANVGLFSQKRFLPSKINAVVNGIRQKLPSKRWPLVVLHNKRITGHRMDEPINKSLIEKWKNADALYATPTGSNDDWYWLFAAIKFKCLMVTNDEMRDHTFQLLGNDFFPKWKERHQVRFTISDTGPVFHMPPTYSVVIQESEKGYWHIPVVADHDNEAERAWLCISRTNTSVASQDSITIRPKESQSVEDSNQLGRSPKTGVNTKLEPLRNGSRKNAQSSPKEVFKNLRVILSASGFPDNHSILSEIEAAEELGNCVIDFQI